jgi:lysozyme family protein
MRVEEAAKIFHEEYWSALACDALPGGVDYSVFDYGVNSGCKRAGKVLRRLVGLRDDDWRVSDGVISATAKRDPKMLVAAINEERLTFLKQLSTWPVFGKGWARRVADVRSVSLAMTSERAAGEVVAPPAQNVPGKAHATVSKKVGGAIAAGATAGVGGILAAAKEWVVAHPIAAGVLTLVAIAVGVLVVCAIARWRTQRQEAPTPGFDALPTFH